MTHEHIERKESESIRRLNCWGVFAQYPVWMVADIRDVIQLIQNVDNPPQGLQFPISTRIRQNCSARSNLSRKDSRSRSAAPIEPFNQG